MTNEEERQHGVWGKWVISEVRCPECLEYFDTDCYSKEEMKRCPNCGADMRVKNELKRVSNELNSEIENSKSEIEYKEKVKELENAIAKCEKAEKEFKRKMPAEKLSDITTKVTDIFRHSEFYDCTLCGGEKDCLECKKEHTVYELLDVIASLHNELHKEVTGKYYDYMYHWANLGYGGTPDDGLFKKVMISDE